MKILIADKFPDAGIEQLKRSAGTVTLSPDLGGDSLTQALASEKPDVLIVRSTKVQVPHLDAAPSLALIIRAGAGTNTIDIDAASSRGVYVANCPGKNSIAVAELAFAHILSLDRRLVESAADLREGRWNKKEYSKAEGIYGRTLGLLGMGGIGKEMIARANAFGLGVVAWSRSLTATKATELGVQFAETPMEVARNCDILSVHLAKTPETNGIVSKDLIAALPDGAFVINTSRGGIVDEAALADAVKNRGFRAGLDVFDDEPSGGTAEIEPGIFATPAIQGTHHIGASTTQAQDAVADETIRIVKTFIEEGTVPNCVNLSQHADATHMLVCRHRDEVGVLASVLDGLSAAGINVQEMENVVFKGGDAACARIQIDRDPGADLVKKMEAASPHVLALSVTSM